MIPRELALRRRPLSPHFLVARPLLVAIAVVAAAGGCGRDHSGASASRAAEHRSWVFDGQRTGDPTSSGVVVAFMLDGGRIQTRMACNTGSGDYTWDGDRLIIDQLTTTLAGCGDEDEVAKVTTVLRGHPLVTVNGSTMTMTDSATSIVFHEVADDTSVQQHDLEGTWTVLTPAGANLHVRPLTFDATGRYRVVAGCSDLGGQLAVVDGRLSAVETTGAPVAAADCVTPTGSMPQDDPVAHVLTAGHVRRIDGGLEVLDTSGNRVAILRPPVTSPPGSSN